MKINLCITLSLAATLSASAFTYPDFSSTAGLNLVGSAAQNSNFIRLTPNTTAQYGTTWYTAPQNVASGFTTTFQFRISNPTSLGGGDGIAFAMQNVGNMAAGTEYGAFSNNFGITFNTFYNGGAEPSDNFVGLVPHTDAAGNATYQSTYNLNGTGIVLKDGNIHSATLNFDGHSLSLTLDGLTIFSNVAITLGDATDAGGNSYVGFGARTGLATENHDILNWSFASVPEPNSAAILAIGSLILGRRFLRRKNRSTSHS